MYKIIPFIGPPYSGKSSVLEKLQEYPVMPDFKVIFLTEIATALMKDRTAYLQMHDDDPIIRQHYILRAQLLLEEFAIQQAIESDKDALIVTDRGLWDLYVYLTYEESKLVVEDHANLYLNPERYDHLLFFEKTMILDNSNPVRFETDEDSVNAVAKRTNEVWRKYYPPEKITSVPFYENLEDKTKFVAETLNGLFGAKIFKA